MRFNPFRRREPTTNPSLQRKRRLETSRFFIAALIGIGIINVWVGLYLDFAVNVLLGGMALGTAIAEFMNAGLIAAQDDLLDAYRSNQKRLTELFQALNEDRLPVEPKNETSRDTVH